MNVEHDYAAKQSIAATGLTPAGHATVWAATQIGTAMESAEKRCGRPRKFIHAEALDAAMRVFWKKGYRGASLSDLTEAMGIRRPSLYMAFGNKEALFRMAMARYEELGANHISECLLVPTARQGIERILRDGLVMFTDRKYPGGSMATQGPMTCSDESVDLKRDVSRSVTGISESA